MSNVLLFREPSPGPSQDRYEALLQKPPGYDAKCVPVLETVHSNVEELGRRLLNDYTSYSGVMITSKRSCDAFHEALRTLFNDGAYTVHHETTIEDEGVSKPLFQALAFWSTVPFYVVGEATSSAIQSVQSEFSDRGFREVHVRGQASGTGEQLGHFIVNNHPHGTKDLLYLTGDKNRDTVPTLLKEGGVAFQALRVYETQARKDLQELLDVAIQTLKDERPWWLVYFAPSSAGCVAPLLKTHPKLQSARIAAIGPVTSAFLQNDLGLHVHVVAQNPKPEDLVHSILEYDKTCRYPPAK